MAFITQGEVMQRAVKALVGVSILMMAMTAVAGDHSGKFNLSTPAELNGKTLKAGDYKVSWDGQGTDVQVTISQGKNAIVTAPARLVEREAKAPRNAVVMRTNGGDTGSIVELQLAGKQSVLVFDKAATVADKQAQ
jgi:hypothetical protein